MNRAGKDKHRGRLADLVRADAGFTLIEGLVAAILLVIGALAVLQLFDTSTRANYRAEQSQALNNRLQAELEELRSLPFQELALTAMPAGSADENNPGSRVSGSSFTVDRNGEVSEQLVVNGTTGPDGEPVDGGLVDPGPEPFSAGDVSGRIYRYVTWTDDPDCPLNEHGQNACGQGAVKRVIVAGTLDDNAVAAARVYQELQTEIVDTELVPDENPAPPSDPHEGNVAELWLTDTTCDKAGREPIGGDHPLHNTRGRCQDGQQQSSQHGAPDLLIAEPPEWESEQQPAYDYASDFEPPSGSDIGLLMPWSSSDTCLLQSSISSAALVRPLLGEPHPRAGLLRLGGLELNKHARVHYWLTPPVAGEGGKLPGDGTLELWSKTIAGAAHPGEICVTLFVRTTVQAQFVPDQICPPLVASCVSLTPSMVDLDADPPRACPPNQGCVELPVSQIDLEVDRPLVHVGGASARNGLTCDQGMNRTYLRCRMASWPTEWSKVSVPLDFMGLNGAGQVVEQALEPGSRLGLALLVKKSGTVPGNGLEFMYDHPDFESRLQLHTDRLIGFGAG